MDNKPRRKRSEKPSTRRYQLTRRDHEILRAVGRMGQAQTEQIRCLFFGDTSTASRRLAKLVALGMLAVHVCSPSEPNVYVLTEKSISLLETLGIERQKLHRSRVGRAIDQHVTLLNDLRVALVCAVRERHDVELLSFFSDLDLRRAAGATPPPYIPDAIFELRSETGTLAVIVEIDTGTEGLSTFSSKVAHTMELKRSGRPCWGAAAGSWWPLVLAPSTGRARALARAITEAEGGAFWLVAQFDRLEKVGALGPLFAFAESVAATPAKEPISYRGALAPLPRKVPS